MHILSRLFGTVLLFIERKANKIKAETTLNKFKKIGAGAQLEWPIKTLGIQNISIGTQSKIGWHGWLLCLKKYGSDRFTSEIIISDYTYIGNYSHIVATRKIYIGNRVLIADRVYIADNTHDYATIDNATSANRLLSLGEIEIGDETWIGENVCIFGNVKIGKHCVVAANSVLSINLPDYCVAAGAPAVIIKRYNSVTKAWEKTDASGNFVFHVPSKSHF